MLAKQKILIVVPARGGSKGVPLKNLRKIGGISLVERVGLLIQKLDWVDRAVVSTDHPEIAKVAKETGLAVPFWRSTELAGDRVGDIPVLQHALRATEVVDETQYDIIVMLQPTSPLRRAEHVFATVEKLITGKFDAVWTVSPIELKFHPLKQLTLDDKGLLNLWDKEGAHIIARQQLNQTYYRNGAVYALTRDCLLNQASLLGTHCSAVIIHEPMLSIDTEEDFAIAEKYLAMEANKDSLNDKVVNKTHFPSSKVFVIDIDGVIASLIANNDYTLCQPIKKNIEMINALYRAGHRIILFTARGSMTGIDWFEITRQQLAEWRVLHHDLRFGKPAADFYIDDRMIALDETSRYI